MLAGPSNERHQKHYRCYTPLSTMLPILQRQQKLTTNTCSDLKSILAPQSASLCRRRGATTDLFIVAAVHGRTKQNVVLHRPVDDPRLPMNRLQGEGGGGTSRRQATGSIGSYTDNRPRPLGRLLAESCVLMLISLSTGIYICCAKVFMQCTM